MNRTLLASARVVLSGLISVLPDDRRRAIERYVRGIEEDNALRGTDYALVSMGKSGRTWLRLMLSRFYQQRFGLSEGSFLEYDNLHRMDPAIPRVFFTHGNYLKDYTGHADNVAEDFASTPLVLLVRDPRDIAVSQYFQWAHRMRPHKKFLNGYPPHGTEMSVQDFVVDHPAGLDASLLFLKRWADALPKCERALVIRYEDLRVEPGEHLRRALSFMGAEPREDEVRDAVDFAAFDNMRKLEEQGGVRASGVRLVPGRHGDKNTYKVRRAKVGGYRDYFDEETQRALEARVVDALGPAFGYAGSGPEPASSAEGSADQSAGDGAERTTR